MARVIQNFGLFWERDQIDWGSPGKAGHLRGYVSNPDTTVDFREQRGIYVLYEGDSIPSQRVVYVGQAGSGEHDLFRRLRNHRDKKLWNRWQRFSWFGFLSVGANKKLIYTRKAAVGNVEFPVALDQVEAVLIALFEPLKNLQGPKWRGASEYLQYRKDE